MKRLQSGLVCLLLASLVGLVACVGLAVWRVQAAACALQYGILSDVRATRVALVAEVHPVIPLVDKHLTRIENMTESQVTSLRRDVMARADSGLKIVDRQATAVQDNAMFAIREQGAQLNARAESAIVTMEAFRADLRPTLTATAALATDAKDSLDDLYPDIKAATESGTVAANQIGQVSMDIRAAVPLAINTWQSIGLNVNSTAENVSRLTKPRWYDRLLGYGFTGAAIFRDLNPSSNAVVGITRVLTTQH